MRNVLLAEAAMALQVAADSLAPLSASSSVLTADAGAKEPSLSSSDVSVHREVGIWGSMDEEDTQVLAAAYMCSAVS